MKIKVTYKTQDIAGDIYRKTDLPAIRYGEEVKYEVVNELIALAIIQAAVAHLTLGVVESIIVEE